MNPLESVRIAIVGAGPSGLSLAWYLKLLGFRSVDIFEATTEVGGQSHTVEVEGVPVELGTCYLTDGYIIEREIAADAGCPAERLPPATFLDAQGNIIQPVMPPTLRILRYVVRWLLWYFRGQMRNPGRPENALTFTEWLRREGMSDLAQGMVFTAGCTAQLYGPLDDISAYDGLMWVRPSLLWTGRLEHTAHIPEGFQNLWRQLCARRLSDYPIHFETPIDEVRPLEGSGARVQLYRGGEPVDEPFDHVFLGCPLDGNPENGSRPLEHPLSRALRERFSPFDATEVYSAIWRAKSWPEGAPSRCYLPAAGLSERGRLLTIRQYAKVGEHWVGQLCSYAIDDRPPRDEAEYRAMLEANRAAVVTDMERIVHLTDVEIVEDRLWRYSIRFSPGQLRERLPAYISERQGREGVWYSGGGLSHWDLDSITDFNQGLAWRFARSVGLGFFTRLKIWRLRDLFRDL